MSSSFLLKKINFTVLKKKEIKFNCRLFLHLKHMLKNQKLRDYTEDFYNNNDVTIQFSIFFYF